MTVAELIKELQNYPQDWKVLTYDHDSTLEVVSVYTYDEGEVVVDVC